MAKTLAVSEGQLSVMLDWLQNTESADAELLQEVYDTYRTTPVGGRASVSVAAVREALYYSENSLFPTARELQVIGQLGRRV